MGFMTPEQLGRSCSFQTYDTYVLFTYPMCYTDLGKVLFAVGISLQRT